MRPVIRIAAPTALCLLGIAALVLGFAADSEGGVAWTVALAVFAAICLAGAWSLARR